MLKLIIPEVEYYDNDTEEFMSFDGTTLYLEHSLLAISKWEEKYNKPFLVKDQRTREETLGYIECMILGEYQEGIASSLTPDNLRELNEYVDAPATATVFADRGKPQGRSSEIITSELVYYWMVAYQIPFECETWHLNRLFTLVKICSIKNSKDKKMSKSQIAAQNRALNEQRKAQFGTSG